MELKRGLIFGKRNQYGSKAKTPDKWKWIWDEDWENKGKLPKKKRKNETVQNMVFNEENTRAKFVNEMRDSRNDPSEYHAEFTDWLIDILGDETDAEAWVEEHGREIELFRVNGRSAEDAAAQTAEKIFYNQ